MIGVAAPEQETEVRDSKDLALKPKYQKTLFRSSE